MILEQALLTDNWVPFTLSYKIYSLLDYFFKVIAEEKQLISN